MSEPLILVPGQDPPLITPYCRSCDVPVERFCMDVVTSPYYVGIHGECHGVTMSARLPVEEVFRLKRTNAKFYLIVGKGRAQGVSEQLNTGFRGVHG